MKPEKKTNYQKIVKENYNLYLIPNKGLHNFIISVCFTTEASKEKNTYYNVLGNVLSYATFKYQNSKELLRKCQDIYATNPRIFINRYGNYLRFKVLISALDSIYLKKENLIENVKLLSEVIYHPLVKDNKFNSKYFKIVLNELKNETKSIQEDARVYANLKVLECLDIDKKDANYKLTGFCDLDVLKTINEENLYQCYLDLINNSKIDIFISGNVCNSQEFVDAIKENFEIKKRYIKLPTPFIYHQQNNNKIKAYHEIRKCSQSKISLACKMYHLTEYENYFVMNIYNEILGGGAACLLMKHIREENNLCYYINSYCNKMDNLIIINSAINKENYVKAIELIQKVLEMIKQGKFTKRDLNNAKATYLAELEGINDSNNSLIEYTYGLEIFHSKPVEERKQIILNISKEDVIAFAQKVFLETVFFLEGDL